MNLVNAIALFLPLYFLSMIAAVLGAGQLMRLTNRANYTQHNVFPDIEPERSRLVHYSFIGLFIFFLVNFIAEGTAWIRVALELPNYTVYTFNYAINVPALFLFFAIQINHTGYRFFLAAAYGGFICMFVKYELWLCVDPIPFIFGIVLFSSVALAAIFFLTSSLIRHLRYPNRLNIHLGIVILVYNFLALFIAVFMLDHKVAGMNPLIHFYVNGTLALLFYLCCAIVMFRFLKKSHRKH